jgi:hypothetical protein
MNCGLARGSRRRCPAPVLLVLVLACTRASSDSCTEGQECGDLAGSQPPAALISMPAGGLPAGGCGDGVLDVEREECDDGSACRDGRDCTEEPARCQVGGGDRSCSPRAGDGCSADCRVEPGYSCTEPGACQLLPPSTEAPPEIELSPGAPSTSTGSPALGQAGASATPPRDCEPARFTGAERVQGLGVAGQLWAPALSSDGSTLYFAAAPPGAPERIFSARRSERGRRFEGASPLPGLDSGAGDGTPMPSHDGLRLYLYSRRAGGSGDRDLWLASRSGASAAFDAPSWLPGVNTTALEHLPWLSTDELTLLFVSTRAGGLGQSDLWLAQREQLEDDFGAPALLRAASSTGDEGRGVLSLSGRTLIFASNRAGGQGQQDLWLATRADGAAEFGEAVNLTVLNGPALELDPFLSLDERELFFVSDRDGPSELWRAELRCDD